MDVIPINLIGVIRYSNRIQLLNSFERIIQTTNRGHMGRFLAKIGRFGLIFDSGFFYKKRSIFLAEKKMEPPTKKQRVVLERTLVSIFCLSL